MATVTIPEIRYGRYNCRLFLMFVFASRKYRLLMFFTTCRQYCQRIGYLHIKLLVCGIATVNLMEDFSILDKQNTVCMAGCFRAVRYHDNGLSFCIDLGK